MNKQLILHIGAPKTGTSALQNFIHRNREFLLKTFKIYYPETGLIGSVHDGLAKNLSKGNNLIENFIVELKKNYDIYEKVLISSENFFHLIRLSLPKFIEDLFEKLDNLFSELNIVLYVRRQDKFLESSYKQNFKDAIHKPANFFFDNFYAHRNLLNYYENINIFLNLIPTHLKDRIRFTVRIYEVDFLKNKNIIIDFFEAIFNINMQDYNLNLNVIENPSLSVETVFALRKFNEQFLLDDKSYKTLVDFAHEIDKQRDSLQKFIIGLDERKKIINYYYKSNKNLFNRILSRENIFNLPDEEIKLYEEHDRFVLKNKEKIEIEIEERYKIIKEFAIKQLHDLRKYKRDKYISNLGYKNILGWVDTQNSHTISGWVYNLNINKPAEIEIFIDGHFIFSKKCNIERKDIYYKYGADFYTGFYINLEQIDFSEELVNYILNKAPNEILNIVVREKISGYGIQGNYEGIYVKDLLSIIENKGINITKMIRGIKYYFITGFILQQSTKIQSVSVNKGRLLLKNVKEPMIQFYFYLPIKEMESKEVKILINYENGLKFEKILKLKPPNYIEVAKSI